MYPYQKQDVDKNQENITSAIKPTKKITDLEEKLKFSETFENQTALADAYLEAGMHEQSIANYEASLKGTFHNDFHVISKLQEAYYFSSRFEKAIASAERIIDYPKFNKSRASFLYALVLEKTGKVERAETYLSHFDVPYNKYLERLELAKFYIRNAKTDKARQLLKEIGKESVGMSAVSYRENKIPIDKAKELLDSGL